MVVRKNRYGGPAMDECKEKREDTEVREEPAMTRGRKKLRRYIIAGVLILIVDLIAFSIVSWSMNQKLKSELSDAEKEMQILQDLVDAEQDEKEGLQTQLDELLSIQNAEPVITSTRLREQLESVRELVTQKYFYTDADRGEYHKTWIFGWDMPFSDKSFLIRYDGIIKAGIDLNEVEIDVNEDTRTIIVTLPPSRITDNNVPQETIETIETKDGLFNKVTIDDSNALITERKKVMEQKAIERGLLVDADAEAQAVVKAFFSLVPGMDTYHLEFK